MQSSVKFSVRATRQEAINQYIGDLLRLLVESYYFFIKTNYDPKSAIQRTIYKYLNLAYLSPPYSKRHNVKHGPGTYQFANLIYDCIKTR